MVMSSQNRYTVEVFSSQSIQYSLFNVVAAGTLVLLIVVGLRSSSSMVSCMGSASMASGTKTMLLPSSLLPGMSTMVLSRQRERKALSVLLS